MGRADVGFRIQDPAGGKGFHMLSKEQIIDGIQQINRSAQQDWLMYFDTSALRQYLDHLQRTIEPRGGHSVWVRRSETTAVVTREPV